MSKPKFKLRFVPYDEVSKRAIQTNGYNSMLDILLSKKKSWRSVIEHLEGKWKAIPNLRQNMRLYGIDENTLSFTSNVLLSSDNLTANVFAVLESLHLAFMTSPCPATVPADGVVSTEVDIYQCFYEFTADTVEPQKPLNMPVVNDEAVIPQVYLQSQEQLVSSLTTTPTPAPTSALFFQSAAEQEASQPPPACNPLLSPSRPVILPPNENTVQMLSRIWDATSSASSSGYSMLGASIAAVHKEANAEAEVEADAYAEADAEALVIDACDTAAVAPCSEISTLASHDVDSDAKAETVAADIGNGGDAGATAVEVDAADAGMCISQSGSSLEVKESDGSVLLNTEPSEPKEPEDLGRPEEPGDPSSEPSPGAFASLPLTNLRTGETVDSSIVVNSNSADPNNALDHNNALVSNESIEKREEMVNPTVTTSSAINSAAIDVGHVVPVVVLPVAVVDSNLVETVPRCIPAVLEATSVSVLGPVVPGISVPGSTTVLAPESVIAAPTTTSTSTSTSIPVPSPLAISPSSALMPNILIPRKKTPRGGVGNASKFTNAIGEPSNCSSSQKRNYDRISDHSDSSRSNLGSRYAYGSNGKTAFGGEVVSARTCNYLQSIVQSNVPLSSGQISSEEDNSILNILSTAAARNVDSVSTNFTVVGNNNDNGTSGNSTSVDDENDAAAGLLMALSDTTTITTNTTTTNNCSNSNAGVSSSGRSSAPYSGRVSVSTDMLKSIVRAMTPNNMMFPGGPEGPGDDSKSTITTGPAKPTSVDVTTTTAANSSRVVRAGEQATITGSAIGTMRMATASSGTASGTSSIPLPVLTTPASNLASVSASASTKAPNVTTVVSATIVDPLLSYNPLLAFYTDQGLISDNIKRYHYKPDRQQQLYQQSFTASTIKATSVTNGTTGTTGTTSTTGTAAYGDVYRKKRRITPTYIGPLR